MGRKSLVNERRAEISQAFYRCIVKQGYTNTSVRDIAREAGLGLGLITHYYESKHEILYALADHIFDSYRHRFQRFSDKGRNKPPRERLMLAIRYVFTEIAGDRDLIVVFQ